MNKTLHRLQYEALRDAVNEWFVKRDIESRPGNYRFEHELDRYINKRYSRLDLDFQARKRDEEKKKAQFLFDHLNSFVVSKYEESYHDE